MEMGFLGIAISMRVRKCTGSSVCFRFVTLVVPPFVIFLSAELGVLVGSVSSQKVIFNSMINSFAVVCLLHLAINELLWEARYKMCCYCY